jgi:type II secretory pathway component PulK
VYDDDLTISVQDARGLLNLNVFNEAELARLLAAYGVPPEVHQSLINRLLDYRETSDLPRLGGAKRQQYAEANRPPPPGQPLITPWQARAVLGWENYPRLWEDPGLPNLTSAGIVVGINVNTAPIDLLGAIFMIPAEQLSRLAQARESVVLHSSNDLRQFGATAASGDPMRYISFPSDTFIVTLQGRRAPIKSVISLALTPIGLTQPWRIDYALEIPFGSADAERTRENVARFPAVVSNPVAR